MKFFKFLIYAVTLALVTISCGTDSSHFKLEGRLLNLNQGEFTVYSPDGAMGSVDTLKVMGGRFDLLSECLREGTAIIVMPNGSEVPVFVEPGASLTLNGDAQNLDMVEVTGTNANKLMNEFRKASSGKNESLIPGVIMDIVGKYPDEIIGLYLVRHYLLPAGDYDNAAKVVDMMLKEQKDNPDLVALHSQLNEMRSVEQGKPVPAFITQTVDGRQVSAKDLRQGVAVVVFWASWDSESNSFLRQVIDIKLPDGSRPTIMGVSFDADKSKAKIQYGGNDKSDSWYNVCDGQLIDSHLAHIFSVSQIPTCIIIKNGKIVERKQIGQPAITRITQLLK